MGELVRFALLGLGLGAVFALTSQGLIVVYRGSGVLNLAHGAIGMWGAFVAWELQYEQDLPFAVAAIGGVLTSVLIGVLSNLLVMRPLRSASPLARVVATLGLLITLQSAAVLRYSTTVRFYRSELPTKPVVLFGEVAITPDRLYLVLIALLATTALWCFYRFTRFGIGTAAVAENERTAASLGWSPNLIATVNWGLGSGLAAAAAILIAPIITLQVGAMTNLVLAGLAAALVAGFRSFPIALVAGLAMGVLQTVLGRYVTQQGVAESVPFLVIIVVLVIGGRSIPLRDFLLQRLPTVGSGRVRPWLVAVGLVVGAVVMSLAGPMWQDALTITFGSGVIFLSLVILTGYAGQLSLAQVALAGFGAWVAARLVVEGLPFLVAVPAAVVATGVLGALFALPAVRTRGISLAVVTLGLGAALQLVLFLNGDYTGGAAGLAVGDVTVFDVDLSAIRHPARYGVLVLIVFTLCGLVAANLRRGRTGRAMIAIRTNERAAAALGVNVAFVKFYAFCVSAAFAGLGGVLLAFRAPTVTFDYPSFNSITAVAWAMIGGIGYLGGPLVAGLLTPGGLFTPLIDEIFSGASEYVPLIGGIGVIALVLQNQNGFVHELLKGVGPVTRRLPRARRVGEPGAVEEATGSVPATGSAAPTRVAPMTLKAEDLSVVYGKAPALQHVSLTVQPGRILGLIGPNGAGKTTLIDAVTGFAALAGGSISLDGTDITSWPVARRARGGVSRSFQSLELFEDSTVLDNLRAASDGYARSPYLTDLIRPRNTALPPQAQSAVRDFELAGELETLVRDLPYGKRRLVAVARAVAMGPSVLLLDEPAAGLSDAETAELAVLVRKLADEWGMAILLIEHDVSFVMSVCDEVVVLDFGKKLFEGSSDEARRDRSVVDAYLGASDEPAPAPVPVPDTISSRG